MIARVVRVSDQLVGRHKKQAAFVEIIPMLTIPELPAKVQLIRNLVEIQQMARGKFFQRDGIMAVVYQTDHRVQRLWQAQHPMQIR